MKTLVLITLVLVLIVPAVGQNLISNGHFESQLSGWKFVQLTGSPANTSGVAKVAVLDGRVSNAIYADFKPTLAGSYCEYVSAPFAVAAGSKVLAFDLLWRKASTVALTGNLNWVALDLVDVGQPHNPASFSSYVYPPMTTGYDVRVSVSRILRLQVASAYVLRIRLVHGGTPAPAFATYVDNISLGTRDAWIFASGSTKPGGTIDLDLDSMDHPGFPYAMASSLGTGPIRIGAWTLGLSVDPLMVATAANALPTVFVGYRGVLGNFGRGRARIRIPRGSALIGTRIHTAFLVFPHSGPATIENVSQTYSFTIG